MRRRQRKTDARRGTTIVELAFVLPVFLLFLMALIEFGHAQMVLNTLRSACRTAARIGSTEGQTTADVEAHVKRILGGAIDPEMVTVFVKDGASLDGGSAPEDASDLESLPNITLEDAEPRALFVVRARVNYNDVAVLPVPFMDGAVLASQAFMRHE
ncbi:MAG: TadE family protein [Planctomycetota bacterium]